MPRWGWDRVACGSAWDHRLVRELLGDAIYDESLLGLPEPGKIAIRTRREDDREHGKRISRAVADHREEELLIQVAVARDVLACHQTSMGPYDARVGAHEVREMFEGVDATAQRRCGVQEGPFALRTTRRQPPTR